MKKKERKKGIQLKSRGHGGHAQHLPLPQPEPDPQAWDSGNLDRTEFHVSAIVARKKSENDLYFRD